jgi:hypothetical protein
MAGRVRWEALAALLLAIATLPALAACAASSYAGIPFAASAADPELQELARRARGGDDVSQLELGIRYEEGRGVAVNLPRAERLYLVAATQPGNVATVYVPLSNGSGVYRNVEGPASFSGNAEALRRWHRLVSARRAGRPTAQGVAATTAPPDLNHQDSGYRDSIRAAAVLSYAFDPIYPGLRAAGVPWRTGIQGQVGARLLDWQSLQDTFLFLLNREFGNGEWRRPTADEAAAFCSRNLSAERMSEPEVRLLILCLAAGLAGSETEVAPRLAAASAVLEDLDASAGGLSPGASNLRVLLYRAGALCGCIDPPVALLLAAAESHRAALERENECRLRPCANALRFTLEQFGQVSSNLLLGYLEAPSSPVWRDALLRDSLRRAAERQRRAFARFADVTADPSLRATCVELELEYENCRQTFGASPIQMPKTILLVANYVLGIGADRCRQMSDEYDLFRPEVRFRAAVAALITVFVQSNCR